MRRFWQQCRALTFGAAVQAATFRIARNDGSVQLSSTLHTNGWGSAGDANYIASNLASYNALGANVTIKITMGNLINYFIPLAGTTLLGMLKSHTKHLWSVSETGFFIAPTYDNNRLGGSALGWPNGNVTGDNGQYLSFWGDNEPWTGGCCTTHNGGTLVWVKPSQWTLSHMQVCR